MSRHHPYDLPKPFWLNPEGRLIPTHNHENWARENKLLNTEDEELYDKYGPNGIYYAMAKKGWIRVFLLPGEINVSKKIRIGTSFYQAKINPTQQVSLFNKAAEENRRIISEKFICFKQYFLIESQKRNRKIQRVTARDFNGNN